MTSNSLVGAYGRLAYLKRRLVSRCSQRVTDERTDARPAISGGRWSMPARSPGLI